MNDSNTSPETGSFLKLNSKQNSQIRVYININNNQEKNTSYDFKNEDNYI